MDDCTVGGSIVAGIGLIHGVECLISANIPTIKGGAMNEAGVLKSLRLAQIAMENRLPRLAFVQSVTCSCSFLRENRRHCRQVLI